MCFTLKSCRKESRMLGFIRNLVLNSKKRINKNLSTLSEGISQLAYLFTTVITLFWLAVFFYGTFYYYYVPVVSQEKPVYFQFSVCESGVGMCSFPVANVSFIKNGHEEIFKRGQPYKIILDIDVPESPANKQLGMFMTQISLYNRRGETVQTSSRTVNLNYRSELLQVLETFVFSPLLVFGYMQQKQAISVELFPHYLDDMYNPAFGAVVEVQSLKVEIYTAVLRIFAQFSGVRYFLYYWPLTSAIFGITLNFFLLSMVSILSWLQIFWSNSETKNEVVKLFKGRGRPPSKKKADLESEPHSTENVGPSHSEELSETEEPSDTDSAPDQDLALDQDGTELLQPTSTTKEESGLRLRLTSK